MCIFMKVLFKTNLFVWFSHFQTQQLKSSSWFIFPMLDPSLVQNDLNYQYGGSTHLVPLGASPIGSSWIPNVIKCVTPGCTWRVHGHMPRTETNFIATIVQPHSCLLHTTLIKHKNMTAEFVSNVMYGEIVEKVGMSPFRIMLAIQNRYGYEMSYDMAWRAK